LFPPTIVQGDSGGKVNIFGGDSIGYCEKKSSNDDVVTEIELFESGARCSFLTPLDFCLWGWIKSEVYKRNVDTRDALLSRISDAAACIRKREDQLRRTTRDLRTRAA
jgi:hypothetical protein